MSSETKKPSIELRETMLNSEWKINHKTLLKVKNYGWSVALFQGEETNPSVEVWGDDEALLMARAKVIENALNNQKMVEELLEALQDVANMCKGHLIEGLEFDAVEVMENVEQAIKNATS